MALSNQAYVIDAVRTAVGKRNGSLAGVHPVDLGALGWRGLLDRVDIDPGAVEDVIAGCVDAIGAQAGNIARLSWLAAGYPEEVPGVTVDRQCGSSQQAISFGAQAIMAGSAQLVVAGSLVVQLSDVGTNATSIFFTVVALSSVITFRRTPRARWLAPRRWGVRAVGSRLARAP